MCGAVLAFYPPDPFKGTDCSCEAFCNYECAINAEEPAVKTYYRMTMKDVYDLTSKDTGDVAGDTSFVIYQKNKAYICSQNPGDYRCIDLPEFAGDDPTSTDLVLEMQVEIDGQWGPYLECNPVDYTNSYGPWHCTTHINHA